MKQPLRVMIDVSSIPFGRGVSFYTSNLVHALAVRPDVSLTLFGSSWGQRDHLRDWMEGYGSRVKKKRWTLPPKVLHRAWQHWSLPLPYDKETQVFHAWDWQLGPGTKMPQVVTIHDLAYKLFPQTAHPDVVRHYDALLKRLEEQTTLPVIAVSQTTKADIVNLTNIAPERIHTIYEALPVESQYVPSQQDVAAVLAKYQLRKPFLFVLGTSEPRKNIPRILEAWQQLKDRFDLVLAGEKGWDRFAIEAGVHQLGYISNHERACFYSAAHAFVFASLYEGFGLPILEAYFHGCPVVTSKVSGMKEVAGDCALLVDPYQVDEIAQACESLEEKGSAARRRREKDMKKQLELFSWDEAAARTAAVYRQALEVA